MFVTFSITRKRGNFLPSSYISFKILSTSQSIPDLLCAPRAIPLLLPCQHPHKDKSWHGKEYVNRSISSSISFPCTSVILTRFFVSLIAVYISLLTSAEIRPNIFSSVGFFPSMLNVILCKNEDISSSETDAYRDMSTFPL